MAMYNFLSVFFSFFFPGYRSVLRFRADNANIQRHHEWLSKCSRRKIGQKLGRKANVLLLCSYQTNDRLQRAQKASPIIFKWWCLTQAHDTDEELRRDNKSRKSRNDFESKRDVRCLRLFLLLLLFFLLVFSLVLCVKWLQAMKNQHEAQYFVSLVRLLTLTLHISNSV